MKQTLVIGSTVVDVCLKVPRIPRRGEDVNIENSEYRIGGCAYNVFTAMRFFNSPALLCSPVGTGIYGSMVRERLKKEGLEPFVNLEQENGCCYCLIEPDGERSFLSHHGAEYFFSRSWLKDIDFDKTDSIFICGLELEETTANEIVDFVCEHPALELFFAPGPRIMHIKSDIMNRLLSRRSNTGRGPFLHLNKTEALSFANKGRAEEAAEFFAEKTNNSIVITMGEQGCYCFSAAEATGHFVGTSPVKAASTVGAGDAHCGALIACLKQGMSLKEACQKANETGARVVSKN